MKCVCCDLGEAHLSEETCSAGHRFCTVCVGRGHHEDCVVCEEDDDL